MLAEQLTINVFEDFLRSLEGEDRTRKAEHRQSCTRAHRPDDRDCRQVGFVRPS
jgi:hypothetical protein